MAYPWTGSIGVPHAVAVLSTARGCGATLLTAAAGLLVDDAVGRVGQTVVLMDADTDCGGLTDLTRYWNATSASGVDGLRGFAEDPIDLANRSVHGYLRHVHTGDARRQDMAVFPLGPGDKPGEHLPTNGTLQETVGAAVERLMELQGCLFVDCGVVRTPVTLEVCRRVQHIILVGQSEPTSDVETAEFMTWLTERGLREKVLGWVCNDPNGARSGPVEPAGVPPALMQLPYDRGGAARIAQGRLPGPGSPLVRALREQMLALWPDVLNDGAMGAR
ncbi:hypothetical protein [Streptomyces sp. KL118A]|uniref:hypothetical protein n=1 Tax=Streptomyces sp. KL118A TaxID=3045153 RepID=UPI00278C7968|nr:hypothetical protein [Streptomyces sp. KL118A]